jgi:hypothetical protein
VPIKHNLNYTFRFLSHWANATRIDVLHSPFVFRLYQSCIKPTPRRDVQQLFDRLVAHLQLPVAVGGETFCENHAIWIPSTTQLNVDEWKTMVQQIGTNGMIVLEKPHQKNRLELLETMWFQKNIHVCIDLFDVCIIMSRQEQAKEYFKLRW